jgi:hypothetical protein
MKASNQPCSAVLTHVNPKLKGSRSRRVSGYWQLRLGPGPATLAGINVNCLRVLFPAAESYLPAAIVPQKFYTASEVELS